MLCFKLGSMRFPVVLWCRWCFPNPACLVPMDSQDPDMFSSLFNGKDLLSKKTFRSFSTLSNTEGSEVGQEVTGG